MAIDQDVQAYLSSLPPDEEIAWKRRLELLRRDCGCHVGGIVMLSFTAAWVVYSFLSPPHGRSWQHWIEIGLLVLVASAVIGKLIGIALARVRFNLTIRGLRRRAGILT